MSLIMELSQCPYRIFGKRLRVVNLNQKRYFIGAEYSAAMNRETFNTYRSLQLKGIYYRQATQDELVQLLSLQAIQKGTHSVKLISYNKGLLYAADYERTIIYSKKPAKYFLKQNPKLCRRKPAPWEVHRSLKKNQPTLAHMVDCF